MLRKKTVISPEDVLTLSKITDGNVHSFNTLFLAYIFIFYISFQGICVLQMQMYLT